MTTKTGTFTGAAASSVLDTFEVAQRVTWSLAGTWTTPGGGISLQREVTPGSGAWQTIGGPYTADASGVFQGKPMDRFRFLSALTSGSVAYSLADGVVTLQEFKDAAGNVILQFKEGSVVVPSGVTLTFATLNDGTTDLGATIAELNRAADLSARVVGLAVSTAITEAAHEGRTILMTGAGAARTFTLPAATGAGGRYRFVVGEVNTSGYIIKSVAGADLMEGIILGASTTDSATDAVNSWLSGATDDTITLDGTTTGGAAVGDWIELEDLSATGWYVRGFITQSGTEATPFSDSVA